MLIWGCAPMVIVQPADIVAVTPTQSQTVLTLVDGVSFTLPTGYTRALNANSRWRKVGALAQGDVLRPVGTIFTIEGRQVHEAYLVVKDGQLQGFYLPGESNYSALEQPVSLNLKGQ
ncbi:MAG: hypothetical protein QM639_02175 [Rhodocyclaceae bacterium]